MDETIIPFGDPQVKEVVSATRINEYCKREFFEESSDPHRLWVVIPAMSWRDISGMSFGARSC